MNTKIASMIQKAAAMACVLSLTMGFVALTGLTLPAAADSTTSTGWEVVSVAAPENPGDWDVYPGTTSGSVVSYVSRKADISNGDKGWFVFSDPSTRAAAGSISYSPLGYFCAAYTASGQSLGEVVLLDEHNLAGDAFQSRVNPVTGESFGVDAQNRPLTGTVIPMAMVLEQFHLEHGNSEEVARALFQDGGYVVMNAILGTGISCVLPPNTGDDFVVQMTDSQTKPAHEHAMRVVAGQ